MAMTERPESGVRIRPGSGKRILIPRKCVGPTGPDQEDFMILSRRRLISAGSTAIAGAVVGMPFIARAQQAEFTYKYAQQPAGHAIR